MDNKEELETKKNIKKVKSKKKILIIWIIITTIFLWAWFTKAWYISNFLDIEILCSWEDDFDIPTSSCSWMNCSDVKPIIYLYPKEKTKINVKLDYKWEIFADYPEYDESIKWWNVIAYPDGKIIDNRDNKEYSYLFWEWNPEEKINWDLSKGFIVKWKDAREFLQAKLIEIWLTPKEYNEFIVYWYPIMMKNKYNLVHFAEKQYTDYAPLTITPKQDSMLRVFMVLKPLEEKIKIEEQKLKHFERKWFTVVEWGGTILK